MPSRKHVDISASVSVSQHFRFFFFDKIKSESCYFDKVTSGSYNKRTVCEKNEQVAQLSQTDYTAGWVSYGQKWKTVTGRQYFTDITGLSSTTVT